MTTSLTDRRFEDQLGRFLADELPDEELDSFHALLDADPARQERFEELLAVQGALERARSAGIAAPRPRDRARIWWVAALLPIALGVMWWTMLSPDEGGRIRGSATTSPPPDLEVHLAIRTDGKQIPRAHSGTVVAPDAEVHVVPSCGRACEFAVFTVHEGEASRVSVDGRSVFDGSGGAPVPIGPLPLRGPGVHRFAVLAWTTGEPPGSLPSLVSAKTLPSGVERVSRSVTVRDEEQK